MSNTDMFALTRESFNWAPIRNCPGRYILATGPSPQAPDKQFNLRTEWCRVASTEAPDPVWYAVLADGGLICFEKADGTFIHTLADAAGFERKMTQLKLRVP